MLHRGNELFFDSAMKSILANFKTELTFLVLFVSRQKEQSLINKKPSCLEGYINIFFKTQPVKAAAAFYYQLSSSWL
jgi:hypothetical protein